MVAFIFTITAISANLTFSIHAFNGEPICDLLMSPNGLFSIFVLPYL